MPELKPVIFIPAYNEAANITNILRNLAGLQKSEIIGHIFVVDDRSEDNTFQLAEEFMRENKLDGKLIQFRKNLWKGAAVYHAIKYYFDFFRNLDRTSFAKQKIIMLDADLKAVSAEQINALLRPLGSKPKNIEITMSVAKVAHDDLILSGQRGFLLSSLRPFLANKRLTKALIASRSGVEEILNSHFGFLGRGRICRSYMAHTMFEAGPISGMGKSGRTAGSGMKMLQELSKINVENAKRLKKAWERRIERINRHAQKKPL